MDFKSLPHLTKYQMLRQHVGRVRRDITLHQMIQVMKPLKQQTEGIKTAADRQGTNLHLIITCSHHLGADGRILDMV